jgi:hypothetical protein
MNITVQTQHIFPINYRCPLLILLVTHTHKNRLTRRYNKQPNFIRSTFMGLQFFLYKGNDYEFVCIEHFFCAFFYTGSNGLELYNIPKRYDTNITSPYPCDIAFLWHWNARLEFSIFILHINFIYWSLRKNSGNNSTTRVRDTNKNKVRIMWRDAPTLNRS